MDRQMIDYLPEIIKDFREYQTLMCIEQTEFEEGWIFAEYALQESVIMTATDYGLSRWEKMLGVTPKATETLDERRFKIISLISNDMPYTYKQLEKQLTNLCGVDGYEIVLDNDRYSILVKVALTAKNNYEAVRTLLEQILPANLIIDTMLKYNQHLKFIRMTHAVMANYTHIRLREEVV